MFDMTGKIAVVTGAGSGIGAAIARAFAKSGVFVYIADRNAASGQEVARSIASTAGQARFIEVDVSDAAACKRAAQAVLSAHANACDVLVNNAGIGHVGTALTTGGDDMDRLWAVNVKGALFMTQAFLPAMIARRRGSVIHMASIAGIVGVRDRLAYSATKSALVGMTKCMALDYADTGVRFNCICPGRVETPWVRERLKEYPDPDKAYREMSATQAIGRMGHPDEIAAAALYLAADESAFVTGSSLIIDGGWSAGKS